MGIMNTWINIGEVYGLRKMWAHPVKAGTCMFYNSPLCHLQNEFFCFLEVRRCLCRLVSIEWSAILLWLLSHTFWPFVRKEGLFATNSLIHPNPHVPYLGTALFMFPVLCTFVTTYHGVHKGCKEMKEVKFSVVSIQVNLGSQACTKGFVRGFLNVLISICFVFFR